MEMEKRRLTLVILAILETLQETPNGCPASTITLALAQKMAHSTAIELLNLCVSSGLIDRTASHWVSISPKGTELVAEAHAAMTAARN